LCLDFFFAENLHFKWGTKPNHTTVNAITIVALGGSFNSTHNDLHNIDDNLCNMHSNKFLYSVICIQYIWHGAKAQNGSMGVK
jgi:hypothetical protein